LLDITAINIVVDAMIALMIPAFALLEYVRLIASTSASPDMIAIP